MPGVTLENETDQRLYVRGRTIPSPQGPIKIFIVAQDPGAFDVSGFHEVGVPGWLKSLAGTALNVAEAAGVPGAKAVRSVATATGLLKGQKKPGGTLPSKAARALPAAARAARAALAPVRKASIVRHLPKGAKIPKKFVEVIPVAPTNEGAGFID